MKKMDTKIIIDNNNYQFILNDYLRVASIINKITGDEYLKVDFDIPIFYLNGFLNGEWIKLLPEYLNKSQENSTTVINVRFGNRDVLGYIYLSEKNKNQLSIKLKIENNDQDFRVCETVGPNIYGLNLGDDYKKNIFIYPHHAGEKTINPIDRYKKEDYQGFWRARTAKTNYGTYRRQINYCGLASMTFMYLYDENNGFYFGSHDLSFPVTGIVAEAGDKENFMGLSFIKYYDFTNGERYSSGEYLLEINNKDWHTAKDIYRNYLAPHLKFHNYPDYLDNQWGLNQCYNFKRQGNIIQNYFSNIPNMYEEGKKHGLNHMFIASWNRGGFDTDYPEYYPDMDLGSGMDFVRGLKYIKENQGIPTLYINARIFDIDSIYASSVGERMAMKDVCQNNYVETYGTKSFTVSCPSDEEWANRLVDTAEFLVHGYGTTGVYLDQLGSAEPFPCYQKNHTHKHIGDFNNGYLKILGDIHNRIQRYDNKSFILTENIGDIYGSYTFGNLTWNGPSYDEYFNVIKYIFPEFIQINMVNPKGDLIEDSADSKRFYDHMERAIVLGSILWFAPTINKSDNDNKVIQYAYQSLKFREALQPMIKKATFMDDNYFEYIPVGIRASVFESEEGYLVIIGNKDNIQGDVIINLKGDLLEAKNFNLANIDDDIKMVGNQIIINPCSKFQYLYIKK